jgi:DNA gyrase/topoisomerase IV subunit B
MIIFKTSILLSMLYSRFYKNNSVNLGYTTKIERDFKKEEVSFYYLKRKLRNYILSIKKDNSILSDTIIIKKKLFKIETNTSK